MNHRPQILYFLFYKFSNKDTTADKKKTQSLTKFPDLLLPENTQDTTKVMGFRIILRREI